MVRCCAGGDNDYGELGDGTNLDRTTPFTVTGMSAGVTAVSAGERNTCAIRNGALLCWGRNNSGQLGDGTTVDRTTPFTVTGMVSGVTAVSAASSHTCAIRNGALLCWGANNFGQLGNGTTVSSTTPVTVTGAMSSGAIAVSAGLWHSVGLHNDGCLFAWGRNSSGQLGDGMKLDRTTPTTVSGSCFPPGPLGKSSPPSGTLGLGVSVPLTWTAPISGTVNHYRYCYSTTSGCTPTTQVPNTTLSVVISGLTPGATYYWQVRACADGTCTVFTDADGGAYWSFGVQALPAQSGFNKSAPASGAGGQPVNGLNLTWSTATDATYYELCYDTNPNGTCNGSWQNVGNTTGTVLNGLTPGVTYEWQVRACNIAGCNGGANNGVWWTFSTVSPPGGFGKSAPGNGATNQPLNPTLSWSPASGTVDHYRYCSSTTSGCTPSTGVGTNTSVALSGLTPGTTYYWQVRACADVGCTVFTDADGGAYWSFSTAAPVGSFNKLAPGNGAINVNTNTAQLLWTAAANANDYKLCLGTAPNNCNIVGGGPGQFASLGNTYVRVLNDLSLQPNTTYYWQVLATNGTYTTPANGSTLAFWSFTTLPSAPNSAGFVKLSPAVNATNVPTQNVTFTWQPATGAVSYTVCVGAYAGDCSYSVTSTATSAVLAGPLPAGATLVWQVTAHNAGGSTGADSNAWWPFTTVPNAPSAFSKLSPPHNATGQPLGLVLSWQDAVGEDNYAVCVGTALPLCNILSTTVAANTTVANLTGLSYGTQYYWQVSACNAGGCAPANSGVAWMFSTQNPPLPGPFQKTAPTNGALGVSTNPNAVLLQWTASDQADGYEVCFGTAPGACDLSGGGFQDVGNVLGRYISQLPFSVTLQAASTYYWQVRAYNNVTATRSLADGGVDYHFTTLSVSGPGGFSKDAPVNGTFNVATASVMLKWFAASGATSYEICVGTAANQCDALPGNAWQNVGNVLQTPVVNLLPGTTYFWQVRAKNGGGTTPANGGAWWTFTTKNANPPADFNKAAPMHLATGVPTGTATLSWYASTGASGYEVCVGSAPGLCEASGGWVNVGNVTSWAVTPALSTATTYWWQVRALGSGFSVQADGGAWWAFTTQADPPPGPGAFGKLQPLQGASERPAGGLQLSWQASANASSYQVCVGTQAGLCNVTGGWVSVGGATSWNAPSLQPATTYWWQVRAVNGSGQAQADGGAWWYFTTAAAASAPGPFGKSAPANAAAGQPQNVTLSWGAASGATGYAVCVGTLPGDCSATGGSWVSVAGTSYALSGLAYDTTYWWQVRAVNANGQTLADGGAWWRFTTGNNPASPLGTFGKSAPAANATGVLTNATLSWGAATNAQRYTVCVGTLPGLCDVMNHVEVLSPTTSVALTGTQAGQTYWWQVWAYNDGQFLLADAGQWWSFTTANNVGFGPGGGPADFTKVAPADMAQVGSLVTLQWNDTNAMEYRVCVGTAWGLCDVVNNVRLNASGMVINSVNVVLSYQTGHLAPGTYWWQVTALDAEGDATQADGGVRWQFTVLNDGVTNLDTSGPTGTRKEVTPTAVRMGEAVSYTIVLSNSGSLPVTARVTDTLAANATLLSATPGYAQSGQTLVWSNVEVPAGGTVVLTVTVRAGSGPLPEGYALNNNVTIGAHDGEITRSAPAVDVAPHRAYVPAVMGP
ncbi:MAG: hypothetical protein KatS3mg052_0076 [Candidatus Roseilinea sp.]|nr:MAG: hypothetical protein KatS3mg052_0076 [Candidatus Roseilinea sp.]